MVYILENSKKFRDDNIFAKIIVSIFVFVYFYFNSFKHLGNQRS